MTDRPAYAVGRTTPTGWDHAIPVTDQLKAFDITDAACGVTVRAYWSGQGPLPWSGGRTACQDCRTQLGSGRRWWPLP